MALEDVAPVLTKEFVTLKLDYDRTPGGQAVQKRYAGKDEGLPWFVFLNADGTTIVTSTGPKGNVGMPWAPHEVEHFEVMLQKARRNLTEAQVAALVASIREFRKKTESTK